MPTTTDTTLRSGIPSVMASNNGTVSPGMQPGEHCEITAIASRSLDKAKAAETNLSAP